MSNGHEFQNDRARPLTPAMLARTPRNIGRDAVPIYRGGDKNALLYAVQRKADFNQFVYGYTTASRLILPTAERLYLLIQNLDAAANMLLGFGYQPDGVTGLGLRIAPGGFYEPIQVPQNDIFIAGSAAGNAAVIYAIG